MIDKTKYIAQQDENVSAVFYVWFIYQKQKETNILTSNFTSSWKIKKISRQKNGLNQIHPLALYFTNEYGSEVAIFENMVRGEFHF